MERYKHFNSWLKNKFGERTLKICVDGGFTCPNRDGTCGVGGCVFCGERGAGENTKRIAIKQQVQNFLNGYKGARANKFIVYFQNFSNTYDTIQNLKKKYDEALCDDRIVGISIATRPDCINEEIVELLKEYTKKYFVMVELGFQTSNENTAKNINRGYNNKVFDKAVWLLKNAEIFVVGHIMVGLLNETIDDVLNTVCYLNKNKIDGVKIHSTYVLKNTKLNNLFECGKYQPISMDFYVNAVANIIKNLNSNIIICRITGDPPKDLLVTPSWQTHKKLVVNAINKKLEEQNIVQGKNCNI